jgi:hypothetical protein
MPLTNLNFDVSTLYILQNSEGDPSWCSLCGFEGSLPILLWARMQDCSFVSSLTTLVMHIIDFMVFSVYLLFLKHWILYFHRAKLLTVDWLERWTLGVIGTLVPPGFEWCLPCGPLVESVVQGSEQMCFQYLCFQFLNVLLGYDHWLDRVHLWIGNLWKHIELTKFK